jgi:2-iminobutanoate/2-iminopropanoate deaminase
MKLRACKLFLGLPLVLAGCAASAPRMIAVDTAPKAMGPYSQAVAANGLVFTSGVVPRDAAGQIMQGDIQPQVNRVFDVQEAVLAGAGCTLKDVVKVTVYITDLNDFTRMNEAYGKRFGEHRPARTTIQAAKLPAGAALEIDMVAACGK